MLGEYHQTTRHPDDRTLTNRLMSNFLRLVVENDGDTTKDGLEIV